MGKSQSPTSLKNRFLNTFQEGQLGKIRLKDFSGLKESELPKDALTSL